MGALAVVYFTRQRGLPAWVALALAVATATYPALSFLATSTVMSECVFTLAQLGAVVLIEGGVKAGRWNSAWRFVALGSLLASFAVLTRPAGVGLLIGAAIYLLKMKRFKQAVAFAAIVALLVGPWVIYARRHGPTPGQRAAQGGSIVHPYSMQFWQRVAGEPLSGTITASDLPERLGRNVSEIGKYGFGALVLYSLFRPPEPALIMRISPERRWISLLCAIVALIGFIATLCERVTVAELITPLSMSVALFWGWEQYRLLLPLVPFLLFYILMGVRFLVRLGQKLNDKPSPRAALVPMLVVSWLFVLSNLYAHYDYIERKYYPSSAYHLRWARIYEENGALIKHIADSVPRNAIIATQNPALVNLYTGHKTVASDDPAGSWQMWNEMGVRYLARTSVTALPPPDANESKYPIVYRQIGTLNLRLVDLGDPAFRPAWRTPPGS